MAANTEKSHNKLKGLAIFSVVMASLGLIFLVCGFFKLGFIEDIALDIWNEIAAGSPQLGYKVSMGPYAWGVYYGIVGVFTLIFIILAIVFFKLAGTVPSPDKVEVQTAPTTAQPQATIPTTTVSRQLYAAPKEPELTPAEKKLAAKQAKAKEKAEAKAKKLKEKAAVVTETKDTVAATVKRSRDDVKDSIDNLLNSILNK